jgi:gentisate 1,2-dioxygenase
MKIAFTDAMKALDNSSQLFVELFAYGTLSLEIYKPKEKDLQQPHTKDEVYVVASGSGDFYCDGKTTSFRAGDFLFVPAGIEHHFENFSDDFITWVIFYGPDGGERSKI